MEEKIWGGAKVRFISAWKKMVRGGKVLHFIKKKKKSFAYHLSSSKMVKKYLMILNITEISYSSQ